MKTRRAAREWAMKVLYAREISGDSLDSVIEHLQPGNAASAYSKFADELVECTERMQEQLDQIIRKYVEKWELERIAVIDHILLRMAICEILSFEDIPPKVTINEAIEIAKKYSTAKSDKFVNGVLDAVMHHEYGDQKQNVESDAGNE